MRRGRFFMEGNGIIFRDDATDEDLAVLDTLPDVERVAFMRSPARPPKRVTAAGWAHLKGLSKARDLMLIDVGITDEGLAAVEPLTNLHELSLEDNPLTDAALAHVAPLKQLRKLGFYPAPITDDWLARIRGLTLLEDLQIGRSRVGDAGVGVIVGFTELRSLDLQHTAVTDQGARMLASLKKLNWLCLDATAITGAGVSALAVLRDLEWLMVEETSADDAALVRLAGLTKLSNLLVSHSKVTDAGLAHVARMPALERLKLNGLPITDDGLRALATSGSIQELELSDTRITDAGLVHLARMPKLRALAVDRCAITDRGLRTLAGIPSLQSWNQRTGKVWVPPGASGGLPLVVYLHGNSGVKDLWGARRMLADEASFKNDNDASNLGNFAGWLLAQGKIRPLIVAAPSDTLADLPGQNLWSSLNFPAFVKTVAETVKANYGVGVDFRQVALVGWSGGGGWPGGGVAKVAKEGARVAGKELLVLGLADGEITGTYAKTISDGLSKAKNTATAIHSVSRPQGGNRFTSAQDCAQGFGLTRTLKDAQSQQKDVKKGLPLPTPAEDADRDAFAFYMDDGDPKTEPKRTVATLPVKEVWRHFGDFKKANASTDKPPRNNEHTLAPLVWSWYALPRFFPAK